MVSIIINNFNYARFLSPAVESALNQTYPNVEVIVVDDGSTDSSQEIIARYGHKIIPVLKANGGQASTFNAGFAISKGGIVCFLDSDDILDADKVERLITAAHQYPQADWFYHPLSYIDADGKALPPVVSPGPDRVVDVRDQMAKKGQLRFSFPATTGLAFSRGLLNRLLPMPEEIRITSDNYLKFCAAGLSVGVLIGAPLACQRLHGENAYTVHRNDTPDKVGRRGQIACQIAGAMSRNFPGLTHFADHLYAAGAAQQLYASLRGGRLHSVDGRQASYLQLRPAHRLPAIWVRTIAHTVKLSIKGIR